MSEEKTIIASDLGTTLFAPPQRQRACLVQYNGASLGKRYILDEAEMVVGRLPTAQIHINEASVSRQHARLCQSAQTVDVEDMGSSNGTFVNDRKIETRVVLKNGDMIRVGTILLKFFAHGNIESAVHDKIYQKATIDPTTQVFNKQYLVDTLESEFKVSRNYQRSLSIIVYDLDHFKKVNDTYGHNAGDIVLRESSQVVKSTIRKHDILARFGGEEFVIILPETEAKTACELAERVRRAVDAHTFKSGANMIKATISLGVAELSSDMAKPQDLIEIADQKLYNSKKSGRNRVTV